MGQTWEDLTALAYKQHKELLFYDALQTGKSALDLAEKQFGKQHIKYAVSLINLANLNRDCVPGQGEAERYYKLALEYFDSSEKYKNYIFHGSACYNYGFFLEIRDKQNEAKKMYTEAYNIYKEKLGVTHNLTLKIKSKL
ncbi:MAG: hypothetical protein MUC49_22115 [Raineya sp.]|nr:hypothetical protein [Raineya sp.]